MNTILKIISQINIPEDQINVPKPPAPDGSTVSTVLSFAFVIGGGIAMIVIILAGIQFILSQGDPAKITKARNAIIYAAIGLALCALAFSIVNFILGRF